MNNFQGIMRHAAFRDEGDLDKMFIYPEASVSFYLFKDDQGRRRISAATADGETYTLPFEDEVVFHQLAALGADTFHPLIPYGVRPPSQLDLSAKAFNLKNGLKQ